MSRLTNVVMRTAVIALLTIVVAWSTGGFQSAAADLRQFHDTHFSHTARNLMAPSDQDVEHNDEHTHPEEDEQDDDDGQPADHDHAETGHDDLDHEGEAAEHDHAHHGGELAGVDRLIRWVGKFHPVANHFPIVALVAAALAELLVLLMGAAWLVGAARYCVLLAAVTAPVVAGLGWADAAFADVSHDMEWVLTTHRWLGTSTAAVAILVAILFELSRREGRAHWRPRYRALLFLSAILVGVTGHFGGTLIYGFNYYAW